MNDKQDTETKMISQPGPSVIVYKTTSDYNNKVAIALNEDKTDIVSFPDSRDVYINGKLAYPIELINGYLLDQRGIDQNVAFIDMTYDTYSKSMRVFTKQQLFDMVIDKNPLKEMYNCGNLYDFKDVEKELNAIISEGKLKEFDRLK